MSPRWGSNTKYMLVYEFRPAGAGIQKFCFAVLTFSSRGAAFLQKTFDCSIESAAAERHL